MRVCNTCCLEKELSCFSHSGLYPLPDCKPCRCYLFQAKRLGLQITVEGARLYKPKTRPVSPYRKYPEFKLLKNMRSYDRKHGFPTPDVTLLYIEGIKDGMCAYCGTTKLLTLDRIRNDEGHNMANLVVSCSRCNYIRRDMPYEAWLTIVTRLASSEAQEALGDWMTKSFWQQKREKN